MYFKKIDWDLVVFHYEYLNRLCAIHSPATRSLITADDERSAALLKVLAAAAEHSQVIVFSHHAHLIEVAHRSIGTGGFKLHMIDPASSIAA